MFEYFPRFMFFCSQALFTPAPLPVMQTVLPAMVLVPGTAVGELLLLPEPLSLWGGLNPETGEIIDRRHPCAGQIVTGKVLALPAGRGSSSASSILLEAVRQGTAPAAIITSEVDGILALGAAVAREMYDHAPPVLVLPPELYARLPARGMIHISESGEVLCEGSS